MRTYNSPVRTRRVVNPKRIALFVIAIAVAVVAIVFCVYMFSEVKLTPEKEQELLQSGTFVDGVSVEGIQLGGLTYAQGEQQLKSMADSYLNGSKIEYSVKEDQYTYSLPDAGVGVGYEDALKQAMLYGREGTRWDLKYGKPEAKDFPVEYTFDETKADALVDRDSQGWGEDVVNASYTVEKEKDEKQQTTTGHIVSQEAKDGWKVNVDGIKQTIKSQVEAKQYAPFAAEIEVLKSDANGVQLSEPIVMGKYTTSFTTSNENRMYNIWKMSDVLNGAVVMPGETFSINDTAGDRNEKNGWKEASGIENGVYTPQYGGGICQVSSTMYNAALRAEVEQVARVPHTIMASYVDPGMDATISTGGPDYKFKNPYDTPIYVIIDCDVPDRKVTVTFYGHVQRDYDLEFESVLLEEQPLPAAEYATNAALDPYEIDQPRKGQTGEKYQIYKYKIDKETGKRISDKIEVTTSTYNPISPKYELGSAIPLPAAGTPIEDVKATRDQLKAEAEAAANPQPSIDPNAQPTTDPNAQPTVDPNIQPPADTGEPDLAG